MKVCFLLSEFGLSGGVAVVLGHARRMRSAHGIDAEIVLTTSAAAPKLDGLPIRSLDAARHLRWDVAIGTWWETAAALFELHADHRVMFLQSLEERFYDERAIGERLGAASVLGLPVHFVAVAAWLQRPLATLRPDAVCSVVRPGIDKRVFAPRPRPPRRDASPLRVLVEGQPELAFKGVPEAIAAARASQTSTEVTLVAPDPAHIANLGADRVVGGLDPAGMATLYADHDVVLKLSRVEGLGLVPLEAMHVGVPCVVTPYTGHEEYVRHGESGLVVGFDDEPGTVGALEALARRPELRARLAEGARATAAAWPSPDESSGGLVRVLAELGAAAPPEPATAARAQLRRQRLAIELARAQRGVLEWHQQIREPALERARATLYADLQHCGEELLASRRELAAIRNQRMVRAAVRARNMIRRVVP